MLQRYFVGLFLVAVASPAYAQQIFNSGDSWVREISAGSTFPGDLISVWNSTGGDRRYGVIEFDLSGVTSPIGAASFSLWSQANGFSDDDDPIRQSAVAIDLTGINPNAATWSQVTAAPVLHSFQSLGKYDLPDVTSTPALNGAYVTSIASSADAAFLESVRTGAGSVGLLMIADENAQFLGNSWGDGEFSGNDAFIKLQAAVAPAPFGEVLEWRNNGSTSGWEIFTNTPGTEDQVTQRIAIRENEDVNILARGDGGALYARGAGGAVSPEFGPLGVDVSLAGVTVTDVSTDDAHVSAGSPTFAGLRVQVTADGNVVELVGGAVGDTIVGDGNQLRGEIAFAQDRYWSVSSDGELTAYARTGNPWSQILGPTASPTGDDYIDVTMRSQAEDYRVFALTETGIDEYAWDDSSEILSFVDSYLDLFDNATGISVDGDQDVVYVSTLDGLLQFDRPFLPTSVTLIDGTRAYLDVDVPRGDARPPGTSAIVFGVVASPVPEPMSIFIWSIFGAIAGTCLYCRGRRRI